MSKTLLEIRDFQSFDPGRLFKGVSMNIQISRKQILGLASQNAKVQDVYLGKHANPQAILAPQATKTLYERLALAYSISTHFVAACCEDTREYPFRVTELTTMIVFGAGVRSLMG
ncbi:hypothetical protein N7G274_004834 [Stereocaulon virgatum]|uniref:Uncharacterized protein n=1 Tax=Stereocaulon virgatum TaxID=373712 RepID=A0ABR4AB71_9LECA